MHLLDRTTCFTSDWSLYSPVTLIPSMLLCFINHRTHLLAGTILITRGKKWVEEKPNCEGVRPLNYDPCDKPMDSTICGWNWSNWM